jgi:type II secretory pathway pseudopilin PulG
MRKAFTLIELMVICAIIAIVIGMVLPVIMVAREEAKALKESAETILGWTFILNGMKAMVTSYSTGKYKIILLGSPPLQIELDKPVVDAIYAEYLKTHVEQQ